MSLPTRVEELARTAACIDTTDLAGLVRLQDDLTDLAESIEDPTIETAVSVCRAAAEHAESIVLRTTDDADATLNEIHKAIDYVQQIADAIQDGIDPSSVATPEGHGDAAESSPPQAELDVELLSAWISSSASALGELEAAVVSIDSGEEDTGQLAEARRIIHTIKGEAGILAFDGVQAVCHDCESLIDIAKERTESFPVDEVLALIDWLRACVEALSDNPAATLPPHDELHSSIKNAIGVLEQASGTPETPRGDAPTDTAPTQALLTANDHAASKPPEPNAKQAEDSGRITETDSPEPDAVGDESLVEFPAEAIIDDTVAEFVCEAREHIANAEQSLLDLESDLRNIELINTVFRAFHTIKGVAGFMHLTPIVRLTHVAETLLDKARSQTLELTPAHLDLFLRSCDVLGQLINALLGTPTPKQRVYDALVGELDHACETGEVPATTSASAPADLDALPSTESPAAGPQPGTQAPVPTPPSAERRPPPEETGELQQSGAVPAAAPVAPEPNPASPKSKPAAKAPVRIEQTVKVNTTRMDALVDMVGELVIGYQMVYQDETIQDIKAQHTKRTLSHVSKTIRDLQEIAMSLRLVTLRGTFQKMARLVRDVSSKAGKNIRFHVEGEDVELDRTVVEEIADPLVHMIRNACDHGIEPEDERRAAGKTPEGNLWLRAYHQGGSIVVEIADDGRGLVRDKILGKAAKNGILPQDRDPDEMSDREVFNLIFAPGFSTAEQVTDISGRGVGMDVVRRNIEALRGKIDISSTPGHGSTFKMLLPLTMAIIDGMIVQIGSHRYVIPTLSIEQSFRPEPGRIHTVIGKGEAVEVRGSLLPVYRAKSVFGLCDGVDNPTDGLLVVLESHSARFCLLVDEIVGQQQVVIKNLGHGIDPIQGVSGGAILGDGRVALILDVAGIVQQATRELV